MFDGQWNQSGYDLLNLENKLWKDFFLVVGHLSLLYLGIWLILSPFSNLNTCK